MYTRPRTLTELYERTDQPFRKLLLDWLATLPDGGRFYLPELAEALAAFAVTNRRKYRDVEIPERQSLSHWLTRAATAIRAAGWMTESGRTAKSRFISFFRKGTTPPVPDGTRKNERSGMHCPACATPMRCVYTRPDASVVMRRRECPGCKNRESTAEKFIARKAAGSTGKAETLSSITQLLKACGLTISDLDPR